MGDVINEMQHAGYVRRLSNAEPRNRDQAMGLMSLEMVLILNRILDH